MTRALLLNADWGPLHFISDVRALVLVIKGRAEIVSVNDEGTPSLWADQSWTSAGPVLNANPIKHELPATIRLLNQVHKKWKAPRFRKKVLFNRDNWRCQYCSKKLHWESITIDHVMPSSRGGKTEWTNCVACCKSCNRRKDDRTPEEAGMFLMKRPTVPNSMHFWDAMRSSANHPDWRVFITDLSDEECQT